MRGYGEHPVVDQRQCGSSPARTPGFSEAAQQSKKMTRKHWRKPGKQCENGGKSASASPVDYRRCLLQENDRVVKIALKFSAGALLHVSSNAPDVLFADLFLPHSTLVNLAVLT
jgi:hypothetical protein